MADKTARSILDSGAGVLELLRWFKDDSGLADIYAASCLEKAKAAEPILKAFEYLARDLTRRAGPLSGIPVGIKDIIATSDMPTTNGSPIYRDHVWNRPMRRRGFLSGTTPWQTSTSKGRSGRPCGSSSLVAASSDNA